MKTVLVTGGARGIGAACAEAFAARGMNVAVNYLSSRAAAEALASRLSGEYGVRALAVRADVSSAAEVEEMFGKVGAAFGGVDVLINNAGISLIKTADETTEEEWDRLFAVNAKAAHLTVRAALPHMISEKAGSIVNVSSMWGISGASCEAAYSASKAAIIGYTQALAKELGLSGIRVNCVCPGAIDTDMNASLTREVRRSLAESAALGRMGKAEEVAKTVAFLALDADFVTGQVLAADGGFL